MQKEKICEHQLNPGGMRERPESESSRFEPSVGPISLFGMFVGPIINATDRVIGIRTGGVSECGPVTKVRSIRWELCRCYY